jgi:hypothetical protein
MNALVYRVAWLYELSDASASMKQGVPMYICLLPSFLRIFVKRATGLNFTGLGSKFQSPCKQEYEFPIRLGSLPPEF